MRIWWDFWLPRELHALLAIHFENEILINCLFTKWKWTYVRGFGYWRWNALNRGSMNKWPSRLQGWILLSVWSQEVWATIFYSVLKKIDFLNFFIYLIFKILLGLLNVKPQLPSRLTPFPLKFVGEVTFALQ